MKLIFYLITNLIFLSFNACSPGSKVIYNKKGDEKERIRIRYQSYRSCKSFFISVYLRKEWVNSFVIRDCSKRFIITKQNAVDGKVNYHFSMVTDTLQNQFKCIAYVHALRVIRVCHPHIFKTGFRSNHSAPVHVERR